MQTLLPRQRGLLGIVVALLTAFPLVALLIGKDELATKAAANIGLTVVAILFMRWVLVPLVMNALRSLDRPNELPRSDTTKRHPIIVSMDNATDSIYVSLSPFPSVRTVERQPDVMTDLGPSDEVVGYDIQNAKDNLGFLGSILAMEVYGSMLDHTIEVRVHRPGRSCQYRGVESSNRDGDEQE
jgi:hypothetical protein